MAQEQPKKFLFDLTGITEDQIDEKAQEIYDVLTGNEETVLSPEAEQTLDAAFGTPTNGQKTNI